VLALARAAHEIWVAKGRKTVYFDMRKNPPSDDDLLAALLGPSGNLRAPTIIAGKKMFVGFSQSALEAHLG
jgi:hypothetical protein